MYQVMTNYLQPPRHSWNHFASPRSEGGPSSGTANDSEVLGLKHVGFFSHVSGQNTPPKIKMSLEKGPFFSGKFIFQSSIFRGYVSFQGSTKPKLRAF